MSLTPIDAVLRRLEQLASERNLPASLVDKDTRRLGRAVGPEKS
jgi:hypothetical protein